MNTTKLKDLINRKLCDLGLCDSSYTCGIFNGTTVVNIDDAILTDDKISLEVYDTEVGIVPSLYCVYLLKRDGEWLCDNIKFPLIIWGNTYNEMVEYNNFKDCINEFKDIVGKQKALKKISEAL